VDEAQKPQGGMFGCVQKKKRKVGMGLHERETVLMGSSGVPSGREKKRILGHGR